MESTTRNKPDQSLTDYHSETTWRKGAFYRRHLDTPTPIDWDIESLKTHPPSSISIGDDVFSRTIMRTRQKHGVEEVLASYQRHRVVDIRSTRRGEWKHDGDYEHVMTTECGEWEYAFKHETPPTEHLVEPMYDAGETRLQYYPAPDMPSMVLNAEKQTQYANGSEPPERTPDWRYTRWELRKEPIPELTGSPKQLTFRELNGEGSRKLANHILGGGPDGEFDHHLPGIQKWNFAFIATNDGHPYSIAVCGPPYNSDTGQGSGEDVLYLTRLCNHPSAPHNTSSWMLGRIRGWLRHHTDVKRIVSIAGVNGSNTGTCYEAAGFKFDGSSVVTDEYDREWTRHRWVDGINEDITTSQSQFDQFTE